MSVLKCKMCGGDLEVTADSNVIECEYCGTQQTIPSADNEKKANLFNRANMLRMSCEFDKAAGVYESIVAEFAAESEAYWGLCLCKYGIEYVDDPVTKRKIPTCHRTSYESIFDDRNFKLALDYTDVVAEKLYREEAKEIDRIQKGILELASREEPYDIFICYKETAEDGNRTIDSTLAQDMYDALTAKGYKVFFARITLEDKLGRDYEPCIFSALNSAKIMLAVGTKYEHFNAVWVKNEWSRFLDLMKNDREKMLIPCYRDIDAYDMPPEFKNLQGQDMSKIGFMQDLIRGIGKIIPAPADAVVSNAPALVGTPANTATTESLLKRVNLFLEDNDFSSAKEYSNKVLDINPECADAYLGLLMCEFSLSSLEDLSRCSRDLKDSVNYAKLMRFADGKLKDKVMPYFEKADVTYKTSIYNEATEKMNRGTRKYYSDAVKTFERIRGWKDADTMIEKCHELIKDDVYAEACEYMKEDSYDGYKEAIKIFGDVVDWKDSAEKIEQCNKMIQKLIEEGNERARQEQISEITAKINDANTKRTAEMQALADLRGVKSFGMPGAYMALLVVGLALLILASLINGFTDLVGLTNGGSGFMGFFLVIGAIFAIVGSCAGILTKLSDHKIIALILNYFTVGIAGAVCTIIIFVQKMKERNAAIESQITLLQNYDTLVGNLQEQLKQYEK